MQNQLFIFIIILIVLYYFSKGQGGGRQNKQGGCNIKPKNTTLRPKVYPAPQTFKSK